MSMTHEPVARDPVPRGSRSRAGRPRPCRRPRRRSWPSRPFLSEYAVDGRTIRPEEPALRQLLEDLYDSEFDEAVADLAAEAETYVAELGLGESEADQTRAEQMLEAWVEPLRRESQAMLMRPGRQVRGRGPDDDDRARLDEIFEQARAASGEHGPVFEGFLKSLVKKAKSIAKGAIKAAKTGHRSRRQDPADRHHPAQARRARPAAADAGTEVRPQQAARRVPRAGQAAGPSVPRCHASGSRRRRGRGPRRGRVGGRVGARGRGGGRATRDGRRPPDPGRLRRRGRRPRLRTVGAGAGPLPGRGRRREPAATTSPLAELDAARARFVDGIARLERRRGPDAPRGELPARRSCRRYASGSRSPVGPASSASWRSTSGG